MSNDISFSYDNESEKKSRSFNNNNDDDDDCDDDVNVNNLNNSNDILRSTFLAGYPRLPFIPGLHSPLIQPWNLHPPPVFVPNSISPRIPFHGLGPLDHHINTRTSSPGWILIEISFNFSL